MPNIIITNLPPSELLSSAVDSAQEHSAAVLDLSNAPLAADESLVDRLKAISRHAIKLAEAFLVIDSLASSGLPSSPESSSRIHQEDTNTN